MTEQRAGLLEADMSRVRHWIDTAVRHAVTEAAQGLNAVRYWCDQTEASTKEWMEKHNPECECEVGETYLNAIAQVRALLPDLPAVPERRADSGGEVDPMTGGTRVTPGGDDEDRDLPGDSQTGGSDSGN